MPKWISSEMGYIKVDDAGNVLSTHPYKYYDAGGKRFKARLNPDGSESDIEEVGNCCFIYVHPSTGEILGSSGLAFYLEYELDGILPTVTCADGTKAETIKLPATKLCAGCGKIENLPLNQVLPPDFTQEVEVAGPNPLAGKAKVLRIGYKWDKSKGAIAKLSESELMKPVKT